ncbi:MAG: cytochrome B [Anaerolineae bacterium]
MTYFILMTHSGWRYIVVILLIFTLVKMLVGWLGKQQWSSFDSRLLLALRTAVYFQVILGALLYILEQYWTEMRFTGEHVIVALLAVGGVEFAAARARKAPDDAGKFKFATIGLAIAFVLIYVALMAIGGLFASRY